MEQVVRMSWYFMAFVAANRPVCAWPQAFTTLMLFACLGFGYAHYSSRPQDKRLAVIMGTMLCLFVSGTTGGLISHLGRTLGSALIDSQLAKADRAFGLTTLDIVALVVRVHLLPQLLRLY
jgi:hypothetical protein